jgi:glycosyltransferase involved in cell wall biosynthesis
MKNALLITAHPDDEILWFGGTILLRPDISWTIACMTHTPRTPRGKDFLSVCRKLKADGVLLGLKDSEGALLDEEILQTELEHLYKQKPWHAVLTHNSRGEYGHSHHRQVSRIVKKFWGKAIQTGFGAQNINGIVRLPEEIFRQKKELLSLYVSEGKHERIKLYPPFDFNVEPMVIPDGISFKPIEKIGPAVTWKQLSGLEDYAHRRTHHVVRIAVLADTKGWAHHIIASSLKCCLPPEFQVDIFHLFNEDYTERIPLAFKEDDYHIIHLMSWRHWDAIKHYKFPGSKLLTTIHGHRGMERGNREKSLEILNCFASVSTVSQRLFNEISPTLPSAYLTPCGVDTQLFFPNSSEMKEPFSYGTVGRFYDEENKSDDIKGWELILKPLERELGQQKARYLCVDKASKIPYEKMPDFYRNCHCYICSSSSEGNPLPLLEAASCGLPLLSTNVGISSEIIREGLNGMILPRNKDAFAAAIKNLSGDRTLCREMGRQSRRIILSSRDWWTVSNKWAEFYRTVL